MFISHRGLVCQEWFSYKMSSTLMCLTPLACIHFSTICDAAQGPWPQRWCHAVGLSSHWHQSQVHLLIKQPILDISLQQNAQGEPAKWMCWQGHQALREQISQPLLRFPSKASTALSLLRSEHQGKVHRCYQGCTCGITSGGVQTPGWAKRFGKSFAKLESDEPLRNGVPQPPNYGEQSGWREASGTRSDESQSPATALVNFASCCQKPVDLCGRHKPQTSSGQNEK